MSFLMSYRSLNYYVLFTDSAHELAISYLSPTGKKIRSVRDERQLCAKIHSKLSSVSSRDAEKFDECYSKLKQFVSHTYIHNACNPIRGIAHETLHRP